jgi:exo-beta-1,3-glucanase (GH17 family)
MFKINLSTIIVLCLVAASFSCCQSDQDSISEIKGDITAKDILGNPEYQAMCYGGYRDTTRLIQPTLEELKEDLKILQAINIKVLRTYNTHFDQAANLLKAIKELKAEDPEFEMYVMLGAWINCKDSGTENPDHSVEDSLFNKKEIETAIELINTYPEIIKIISVGNEVMVKWAAKYYVEPHIILRWVKHLQSLKSEGLLPKGLWVTSSDNFASWGGENVSYHNSELEELVKSVDYLSVHVYPMHDTHYNPNFWMLSNDERSEDELMQYDIIMNKAVRYAKNQYYRVQAYLKTIEVDKPIHIGETGWASVSNGFYGPNGSRATDEYKQAIYYRKMREWTNKKGISCFFFEGFNEIWKDAKNQGGSENHFGLMTIEGKAKYVLWDAVDSGTFNGLTRNGNSIRKTYNGIESDLMKDVFVPN